MTQPPTPSELELAATEAANARSQARAAARARWRLQNQYEVGSITLSEDAQTVVITYMHATEDVRNRGLVSQTHQIAINRGQGGKDYGDEFDDLYEAINALLVDALEDFHGSPAYQPRGSRADDEGDDPEE
jgi:hypothetical protein